MLDAYLLSEAEDVSIPAPGAVLTGTLFLPPGGPRAAAVIQGATGVPARFYESFAQWLAGSKGIASLIYDPRDFGRSGDPRGSSATMTDWGVRDQQAARDWLAERIPQAPLWVIGHSLGGMMLPFQTQLERIDRVVTVASGAVNVNDHPWPYQALARAFWAPGLATLSRRLGYFPARALRLGRDFPPGVYVQWRRWCTSWAFHAGDPDLGAADPSALTAPIRMVAVADDALCPPKSVWRLMQAYPAAHKQQLVLRSEDFGMARIGHLDVLGEKGRPCWDAIIAE